MPTHFLLLATCAVIPMLQMRVREADLATKDTQHIDHTKSSDSKARFHPNPIPHVHTPTKVRRRERIPWVEKELGEEGGDNQEVIICPASDYLLHFLRPLGLWTCPEFQRPGSPGSIPNQ